jgi:hypothetical protein
MAVTWPLGAPPPLDGWTEALARPEESWLWGIVPALAPHPGWLAAADRRLGPDEEPPVDGMPAWIADLLLPAARIEVDYDRGFPARVRIADRTGWARSEWCVEPGAWVRCGDARTSGKVGRIEFDFVPLGRAKEPLLAGVRFLDDKGVPAADFLGRTALTFLYRDVDPDAEVDRWVVEMSIETLARRRRSHGVSADAPSATEDRRVLFYFRRDRDPGAGTRGGEIAAVRAHDHVGRPVPFGYDWGPMVSGIYLQGGRGGREVLFFDVANQQTPDAAGAMGYREEFGGDGLRTRLTFLDVDRGCLATSRTERDAAVEYCEIALFGDPAVRPVPFPDPAMPSGPYALAWRTPHGPGRNADGVSSFALRDLGAAAPPCSSLMVVQHHDAAGALASPARGPFLGTAASRLGLRFRDGRFSDVVRTDCFDGPCADRDVMDETWSCDRNGCVFSTIPLDCTPPAPTP